MQPQLVHGDAPGLGELVHLQALFPVPAGEIKKKPTQTIKMYQQSYLVLLWGVVFFFPFSYWSIWDFEQ